MQIDWWTLALQAINFLVLVWLLQRFLYRPVMAVIARRKEQVTQVFAEAEAAKSAAAEEQRRYEEGQRELETRRQDLSKTMHAELEAERARVIEAARKEAGEIVDAARADIARERSAALTATRAEVAELAVDMAAAMLGDVAAAAAGDGVLDQVERKLASLPDDERRRLNQDLTPADARLRVVTAAPLPVETQQRWCDRLAAALGPINAIDFTHDPDLIGGAILHFPHADLSVAWSDLLQQAKTRMLDDAAAD